jgi:hypothetical protein
MIVAIAVGGALAWWSGKVVKMTDMPQMVAIYNGMGGGAAAAIAALEFARGGVHGVVFTSLATLGALIGAVSFSGSCVAFAKLQGIMTKTFRLPAQNAVNIVLALVTVLVGIGMVVIGDPTPTHAGHHLLRPVAGAGRHHHAADRRCGHAGGDFAVQRLHRAGRGFRRLRTRHSGAHHRRHRGRRGRHAAHAADGQGDEPSDHQHPVLADHR